MASNAGKLQISSRVDRIPEALSIYINQLVYDLRRRNRDVIALSLGEAFFDIPDFGFDNHDIVRGYHYSDSQGLPELRQRIAELYESSYGAAVDAKEEIMVTAGSKIAIFMALQTILNTGDEVLIHEPAWLSYQEHVSLLQGTVRFIPHDCPIDEFSDHFSDRTRCLVINNPNNPSGRVYSHEELKSLTDLCHSRGCYLLVDEAYSDFLAAESFTTLAKIVPDKQGIIICNSLSKNMGMSGWRIGYVIAHPAFIRQMTKLNQHLVTCAPTILQLYLARHFDKLLKITLPQIQDLTAKRRRAERVLDRLKIKRMAGSSTFYLFLDIDSFPGSSHELALQLLLKHGVSVVPGSAYGRSTERFIRISIGVESDERIDQGLYLIKDMLSSSTIDPTEGERLLAKMGLPRFEGSSAQRKSA